MRISVERVHINRQGYDRRGMYWGVGDPLWYSGSVAEAGGNQSDNFVRARSHKAARDIFIARIAELQRRKANPSVANWGKSLDGLSAPADHHDREAEKYRDTAMDQLNNLQNDMEEGNCPKATGTMVSMFSALTAASTQSRQGSGRLALDQLNERADRQMGNFIRKCVIRRG